jgi:hypothetical protein
MLPHRHWAAEMGRTTADRLACHGAGNLTMSNCWRRSMVVRAPAPQQTPHPLTRPRGDRRGRDRRGRDRRGRDRRGRDHRRRDRPRRHRSGTRQRRTGQRRTGRRRTAARSPTKIRMQSSMRSSPARGGFFPRRRLPGESRSFCRLDRDWPGGWQPPLRPSWTIPHWLGSRCLGGGWLHGPKRASSRLWRRSRRGPPTAIKT